MTSRLRQIFKATEPNDVEAASRRRDLAEAMQVRALQGTKMPQEYYTPATALADLGTSLVSSWNTKKANEAYGRAKDAKSAQTAEALKRYASSVPDEQVGEESRRRIMDPNLPADQLPDAVEPRSAAFGGLVDAGDPETREQMIKALMAKHWQNAGAEEYNLSPGEARFRGGQKVAENPANAPKPMDPVGQLESDYRAGLISKPDYDARRKLLTTREPPATLQVQMVTMKPDEIAAAGLPPGTAAQRNVQTGQIDVLSKRDNTGVLNQKDATTAKMKLNTVSLARQQLNSIKEAFDEGRKGVNAFGPGQGMLPTEAGKKFDSRVDQMRSTLTALTRVPGVGAMSDYETKLDQGKFPSRSDYETVTGDKIQQLEDMLALIETGYTDLLGTGAQGQQPGIQAPPGAAPTPAAVPVPQAPQAPPRQQAPPEAVALLKSRPELAEQFKAKYGYLP